MSSKERTVCAIIKFLNDEAANSSTGEEAKESIEVAKQCLETAYGLSPDSRPDLDLGMSLEELIENRAPPPRKPVTAEMKKEAEALKLAGNEHMKAERYMDAVESYRKAIEKDSTNAIYYSNRAAAFNKLSRFQEAIDDCDEAIAIDSNYSKAYGRKGLALSGLNQHGVAIENYKRAIELDPNNENFKTNLEIAEEKFKASGNQGGFGAGLGSMFGGAPGGMPDIASIMNNPAMMQMASQMMQSPGMQQMMSNFMTNMQSSQPTESDSSESQPAAPNNIENFMRAGQQFAEQMQRTNPELVDQLRNQFQGSMGEDEGGPNTGGNQ
ncbi:small glutamine-rich tetratricopeptide repeat-containing protein alpha-like [Watersipora subatra]|uniref:small glutamine-rich tetratricopeptide repeat-containing protein alpha-like n=1 Tax=Watersipora subatra TaxID=2589382 RepID=UPI00355BD642